MHNGKRREEDIWPGAFDLIPPVDATTESVDEIITPPSRTSKSERVQVIELTSKKWKAKQAIGFVASGLSFFAFTITSVLAASCESRFGGVIAGLLLVFFFVPALCYYIYARIGAWWEHG